MLPILSSGQGEFLTIDLNFGDSSPVFCVQPWNPDSETYTTIYDSLNSMLETLITCYKKNVFYISENGLLEMNFEKTWSISKKFNPNSKYWQ
jgi:hypothetical protein